jgi:hypothetical protein
MAVLGSEGCTRMSSMFALTRVSDTIADRHFMCACERRRRSSVVVPVGVAIPKTPSKVCQSASFSRGVGDLTLFNDASSRARARYRSKNVDALLTSSPTCPSDGYVTSVGKFATKHFARLFIRLCGRRLEDTWGGERAVPAVA